MSLIDSSLKAGGAGWVKSASTTQLNKIGPQKSIPIHNTVILKEGCLTVRKHRGKSMTGTLQSKKHRYCVLWIANFGAGLDMFGDETKKKFKRRLNLDRSSEAISLTVKDHNRSLSKSSCLQLRVGGDIYDLNVECIRERKAWCARLRQAINRDVNMLSGEVVGIVHPNDSSVNIQFSCDCIILTCPLKQTFLKTWKLAFVTSFGLSGNTFTFECCPKCCDEEKCVIEADSHTARCLVTSMEAAIMEYPSRSKVALEKNILGDIYHCSHVCLRRFLDNRRASAPPRKRGRKRDTTNTIYTFVETDNNEKLGLLSIPSQSTVDLTDHEAKCKYLSILAAPQHTYSRISGEQPLYSTIEDLKEDDQDGSKEDETEYQTTSQDSSRSFGSSTGDSETPHLYDDPPRISIYDIPGDSNKWLQKFRSSKSNRFTYQVAVPDSEATYDVPRSHLVPKVSQSMYDRPANHKSLRKRWNSAGDSLSPDLPTSLETKDSKVERMKQLGVYQSFLSTQV